jgi:hypothetical protein
VCVIDESFVFILDWFCGLVLSSLEIDCKNVYVYCDAYICCSMAHFLIIGIDGSGWPSHVAGNMGHKPTPYLQ